MIFGRRHAADRARRPRGAAEPQGTPADGPPEHPHDDHGDARSGGLRITEGLLPIFGPAQVGDSTAPLRPASEAERSRDRALRTTLTRVVGADGKSYVVAVSDQPSAGQAGTADD